MKILKWMRRLFFIGFTTFIVLILAGIVYEKTSEYFDSNKYSPPGTIVRVNGHDMHIYTKGNGNLTVVFASGFGIPCPYVDFYPLYNEVSKTAKIAVYDRPGYGWSKVCSTPRDIDTISKELHELLEKSGQRPPYIFVAHSLASLEVIRFAQLYKSEVRGIVTIDAGNPEFYAEETINDGALSSMRLKYILNNLGIFRLLFNNSPNFYSAAYSPRNQLKLEPEELRETDKAMYLKNMVNRNKNDEDSKIKINAATVVEGGNLNSIPLRILTSETEAKDEKWKKSQEDFMNWSTDSTQRIISGTNHNMHQFVPNEINEAIFSLLK
jgi:pimeloyl-ACP methyl ester carboxylesterase